MQVTHVVNIELSKFVSEDADCISSGIYDFETVGATMKVQVFTQCEDDENFEFVFMRILNVDGVEIFTGGSEQLLSEAAEDDGSVLHTVRVALGLDAIFGKEAAIEISDFVENLSAWIDPRTSLSHLDFEYDHTYGTGVVVSERQAQCYVFRTIGVLNEEVDLNSVNSFTELCLALQDSADFDEYSDIDLACIMYF